MDVRFRHPPPRERSDALVPTSVKFGNFQEVSNYSKSVQIKMLSFIPLGFTTLEGYIFITRANCIEDCGPKESYQAADDSRQDAPIIARVHNPLSCVLAPSIQFVVSALMNAPTGTKIQDI